MKEKVQLLLPRVPLVAVLGDRLPEWCTEEDEKKPPVPSQRVDERIRIWAPLLNYVKRKAGFKEASCVCFSFTFIYSFKVDVFALTRFKVL